MSDEAIIREALELALDDCDPENDFSPGQLFVDAIAAHERVFAALRACVQYGIDEDNRCWVAPSGNVDLAMHVLGITGEYIRKEMSVD